jgi:hypothetical protein
MHLPLQRGAQLTGRSASGMTASRTRGSGAPKRPSNAPPTMGDVQRSKGPRNPGLAGPADLPFPVSKVSPAQLDADTFGADSGNLQRTVFGDISGASGDAEEGRVASGEAAPVDQSAERTSVVSSPRILAGSRIRRPHTACRGLTRFREPSIHLRRSHSETCVESRAPALKLYQYF